MLSWNLSLRAVCCLQCGLGTNVRIQGQWHVLPLPTTLFLSQDPRWLLTYPISHESSSLTSQPFLPTSGLPRWVVSRCQRQEVVTGGRRSACQAPMLKSHSSPLGWALSPPL